MLPMQGLTDQGPPHEIPPEAAADYSHTGWEGGFERGGPEVYTYTAGEDYDMLVIRIDEVFYDEPKTISQTTKPMTNSQTMNSTRNPRKTNGNVGKSTSGTPPGAANAAFTETPATRKSTNCSRWANPYGPTPTTGAERPTSRSSTPRSPSNPRTL